MLLGRKYEILSQIPDFFTVHNNNEIIFKKDLLDEHFEVTDIPTFLSLQNDGIISEKNDYIYIDLVKWIDLFIHELQKTIDSLGFSFICKFDSSNHNPKLIFHAKDTDSPIKEFSCKFAQDEDDSQNVIYLCYPSSFDFSLFWLDLVNDINLARMFCQYLNGEFEYLRYDKRIKLDFTDILDSKDIFQLNRSIKEYFIEREFKITTASEELHQKSKNFICKDGFEIYEVNIDNTQIAVIKVDKQIIFLAFFNNTLYYPPSIIQKLNNLREIIEKKVNQYSQILLFNKIKLIDSNNKISRIIFQIITYFGIIINVLLAFYNLDYWWLKIPSATIAFIALIALVFWIILPAFKINKFNWKL
ncbi:hypothetical protein COM77_23300 [Bacillus cereus]|uniref:hypothetical protein n=1 Tax=Bacillus cereus TaxID=1396 RepID=UPI000BEB59D9|nr:hypothetical protein [Bacillus cereus]MDA1935455.1 hypothetical protein [Bacillus cereus]MDA1941360.1 hypothetical protein [Bacillus cereus]PEB33850.1 hypothetical protein COM77_23300 [Bacillus cereus]TKH24128.1 hypothetical protein FC692_21950 [Bacillus cereus]